MGREDDRAAAVALDVFEGLESDLEVGHRDADEGLGVEQAFQVVRQNRIHEGGLPLLAVLLVDVLQGDHVAHVAVGRHVARVRVGEQRQDLEDPRVIDLPHVGDQRDVAAAVHQRRERRHAVQRAAVLVDDGTLVGGDVIAGDGPQNRDFEALRHVSTGRWVSDLGRKQPDDTTAPDRLPAAGRHRDPRTG